MHAWYETAHMRRVIPLFHLEELLVLRNPHMRIMTIHVVLVIMTECVYTATLLG